MPNKTEFKCVIRRDEEKKEGKIEIYDDIGPEWAGMVGAKTVSKSLDSLESMEEIALRINSIGGYIDEAMAMYNRLVQFDARITTYIDGIAASSASFLAMAGDTIKMSESAKIMIHDPWAMVIGNAAEMRKEAEILDQYRDTIADIYASRSGQPVANFIEAMSDETWYTAEQAKELGLVDEIIENKKRTNMIDPRDAGFKNVPQDYLERLEKFEQEQQQNAKKFAELKTRIDKDSVTS